MHDPSVLLFEVPVLKLDVWHDEPGGHDAFEVCGHAPHGAKRLAWTLRHARHLHVRWWRYLNVKKWIVDRCDGCGKRFRWKEARFGFQSSDRAVWHDPCMSLLSVRHDLDDLTGFVLGTADSNARWRANYRLQRIENADEAEVSGV